MHPYVTTQEYTDQMDNDWLEKELTEEEKSLLQKIEEKISKKTQELLENKYVDIDNDQPLDLDLQHPDIMSPRRATDAPHEIKFEVISTVSSIDDKGYIKDTQQLLAQNYFIPILAGEDYKIYIDKFFEVFKTKLTETCKEVLPKPHS